jgi:hypothetical protein
MELSTNAEKPGRVHLHAFVGTSIKGGVGFMSGIVRPSFKGEKIIFEGVVPHLKCCKAMRNTPKTVFDACVNGLYYVIAEKTSTIARSSTLWPVQDSRALGSRRNVSWGANCWRFSCL